MKVLYLNRLIDANLPHFFQVRRPKFAKIFSSLCFLQSGLLRSQRPPHSGTNSSHSGANFSHSGANFSHCGANAGKTRSISSPNNPQQQQPPSSANAWSPLGKSRPISKTHYGAKAHQNIPKSFH